jgi:hypothetical protein
VLSPLVAGTEWEMLRSPATTAVLDLALCGTAISARWRTAQSATEAETMQFNETDNVEIVSLNLGSDIALLQTGPVPHSSHPLA